MSLFFFQQRRFGEIISTPRSPRRTFSKSAPPARVLLNSWPLKDLIAKQITPQLLADVAAGYQAGRRLFVVTTDLDAQRSVVWNMGAIAAHARDKTDGTAALNLFRTVLLASGSIPGAFPPVLIDVEGNGKHFAEMHVDGGVGGQFFVAPPAMLASTSTDRIPASQLYIVIIAACSPTLPSSTTPRRR